MPHLELDAMFHQAGWTPLPRPEFRQRVSAFLEQSDWVVDGNYGSKVGDLIWAAADRVVWVDPSKPRVMAQVLSRTFRRALGRQVLWNGNREAPLQVFRTDPEGSCQRAPTPLSCLVAAEILRELCQAVERGQTVNLQRVANVLRPL